jgi:glycosyltransferase involved in cell wall biosynthesis
VTIRLVAPPRPHAANTVSNTSRIRTIPSVTVVIPAFNEAAVIAEVIADLRDTLGQNADIVVVDDGSSDGTVLKAIEAGARVVSAPYNTGNGAAVKSGIRAATGEFVAIMDGDGQHKASDLLKLLDFAGPYDMVVGARDPKTQASSLRRLANAFYNKLASYMTGRKIDDLTSGMRVIRRSIAREFLPLLPNGFSTPTTLTMSCLRSGYSVLYVPFEAHKRVGQSKIRMFSDGVKFLTIIFKISTLFSPLKVFLPVASVPAAGAFTAFVASLLGASMWSLAIFLCMSAVMILGLGLVSEQICAMRFERINSQAEETINRGMVQPLVGEVTL